MPCYKLAEQVFFFPYQIVGLECFTTNCRKSDEPVFLPAPLAQVLSCHTVGWVGGEDRRVETWSAPPGTLLKISDGSDFYIAPDGEVIVCMDRRLENNQSISTLSDLDREILIGPVLVLALSMRGTWSLHASAAMFNNEITAFLGESGQGKSTLAAYLDCTNWDRVADDILPATLETSGVRVWPHFPQLKLPSDKQPGLNFPEQLPLDKLCLLKAVDADIAPAISLLPPNQAIQVLLAHTAGTRLFTPDLLEKHLRFSAHVAENTPVYQLTYPHDKTKLPLVKELLEEICSL